jgi:hypothetical protein
MSGLSLEDLMTVTNSYKAGATDAANKMNALSQTQADLSSANSDIAKQNAVDSTTVSAAATAATLSTQAKNQVANSTFGTDIGSITDQITKLAQVSKDAYDQKQQALQAINDKSQVSLFDNPIQYLMNQLTINSDIAQHNSANELQQAAEDRIKSLNADTQTQVQTNAITAAPLTVAAADAANRLAASKSLLDANKFAQENAQYSLQGIQAIQNLSKETLAANFNQFSAQKAEEASQISLAHLDLARKQFDVNDQVRRDTQGYAEQLLKEVNAGLASRGQPELPPNAARGLVAAARSKLPISQQYQNDALAGQITLATGNPTVATSPAHLLDRVTAGTAIKLAPGQDAVKMAVTNARDTVAFAINNPQDSKVTNNPLLKNVDLTKKDQVDFVVNKIAQNNINAMATEVKPGDASNVFNVGSINAIAEASKAVQNLPVYQKVLKDPINAGKIIDDFDEAFTMAMQAASKGQITQDELLGLSTIAQAGTALNLTARNMQGFSGLVPSRELNVRLTIGNSIWGKDTKVININDSKALDAATVKAGAAALREKLTTGRMFD